MSFFLFFCPVSFFIVPIKLDPIPILTILDGNTLCRVMGRARGVALHMGGVALATPNKLLFLKWSVCI